MYIRYWVSGSKIKKTMNINKRQSRLKAKCFKTPNAPYTHHFEENN